LKGETNKGGGLGISSGWWYTYPSEKYEFVSWAYYYSQYMESQKNHVPNHQPVMYYHRPIVFEWGSRLLINQPVRKGN